MYMVHTTRKKYVCIHI